MTHLLAQLKNCGANVIQILLTSISHVRYEVVNEVIMRAMFLKYNHFKIDLCDAEYEW